MREGGAIVAVICAAAMVGCRPASPAPGGQPPDVILFGGKIVTVDAAFSTAEAVAVTGGRFSAVGKATDIRALAGLSTQLIDLKGKTVTPGLADNHLHAAGGGAGVDLSRSRRLADVLTAIAERVKTSRPGDVILTNGDWHEAQLAEQRLPLRRDLDTVAPHNPVVVVRGGHEYILNSAALKKWGIDTRTPDLPGGRITRDDDGELNGELVDRARALVTLPPPRALTHEEQIQQRIAEYATLNAAGLTSIRHPGISGDDYRLIEALAKRGALTMRVSALLRPDREADAGTVVAMLDKWGIRQDAGDEWVRVAGIKLGVDGGFEGGWMRDPYTPPFDEGGHYHGLNTVPPDRYMGIVKSLNQAGWRVFTHAVGDAAIDLVLDAYQAANAERSIVGRRWGIEHAFIPQADQIPRMKSLALSISAQNHLYLAGPSLVKYWGQERAFWTTPVRAYLEAGLQVSSGTDSPVVPYSPLWTMYHFVSRDTITGGVMGEDQKISREDALRLATVHNAYLTFEEHDKGTIEVGRLADLIVLSDDIMTSPEKRIEQATVLMTMVGGRVVFEHADWKALHAN